jgi:hypothetical protein
MVVVLMTVTALLVASLAVAVFLDRGPFAPAPWTPSGPPARPAGEERQASGERPASGERLASRERPASREKAVRACDDLQSLLRAGVLTPDAYRQAVAELAAAEARRRPLLVPSEQPPDGLGS